MKAIRKWEWVRNYCIQQSFIGSADIADQIDRVLCYLYGEIDTTAWASNVNARKEGITPEGNIDLSIEAVRHKIVGNSLFCIACEVDKRHLGPGVCRDCKFDELTGWVDDKMSLYYEFFASYDIESEGATKE